MYLGIDQSKRSTGLVLLDEAGELERFMLICPPKEMDGVAVIRYQVNQLRAFLYSAEKDCYYIPKYALIEGLSYGAIGSAKDILAGLNWIYQYVCEEYHNFPLGVVPVTMWRNKFLTKEELKESKNLGKDGPKKAVVNKVPLEVVERFQEYIKLKGFKKDSLYDLCDAYGIAKFAMNL